MSNIIRLDRSRIVRRQECPRARLLGYHLGGLGLQRVSLALPLANGIALHSALAEILIAWDTPNCDHEELVDIILAKVLSDYRAECEARTVTGVDPYEYDFFLSEQCALLEGLVRGWVQVRLPALLTEYTVSDVEKEMEWQLAPGMVQMLRFDAILYRKSDGMVFALEFKSVAWPNQEWQVSWEHNIQILSYVSALNELYDEPCGGVVIEGLVKGMRRMETAASSPYNGRKLQSSPFCYVWRSPTPDGDYLYSFKWVAGKKWQKVATWATLGVKATLAEMGPDLLAEQFISMPPICPLPSQMFRWRRQVVAAETRCAMALEKVAEVEALIEGCEEEGELVELQARLLELMDFHFPQHDGACRMYGSACSFLELCFNDDVAADPLGSRLYQIRVPHHSGELEDAQ